MTIGGRDLPEIALSSGWSTHGHRYAAASNSIRLASTSAMVSERMPCISAVASRT